MLEFRDIEGFEEYQITNDGRVYSKYKNIYKKLGVDKDGYHTVTLWKKGKPYFKRVNRLVAQAFINNPYGYEVVNHKNEIKSDNRVENLEWCSVYFNNIYSKAVPVVQIEPSGKVFKRYNSGKEAAQLLGINDTHINACCRGYQHNNTYKGYRWVYEKDYDPNKDYSFNVRQSARGKKICQFTMDGELVAEYDNAAATKANGFDPHYVADCCCGRKNHYRNYLWQFAE